MSIGFRFGGPDTKAINYVESLPSVLWFSPLIVRHAEEFQQLLISQYLENGAALFGRESSHELQVVRDAAHGQLDGVADRDLTLLVQYFLGRARNYGHLGSMAQAMIDLARICYGGRNCNAVCAEVDGALISITDAVAKVNRFAALPREIYYRDVFGKAHGFPPMYVGCSCRLEGVIEGVDE